MSSHPDDTVAALVADLRAAKANLSTPQRLEKVGFVAATNFLPVDRYYRLKAALTDADSLPFQSLLISHMMSLDHPGVMALFDRAIATALTSGASPNG